MAKLEELMDGFMKRGVQLYLRSFNNIDSPVPCSSDIQISPEREHPNIIKKTKKMKKRPANPIKLLWEFFQYEALSRLFKHYRIDNTVNVATPEPFAVFPKSYTLFTEFIPGFILKVFGEQTSEGMTVKDYDGEEIRAEYSVAFHLGYISGVKEIEGIYHSDFDPRHIIFDAEDLGISMFDLENTRFLGDKQYLEGETAFMKRQWFDFAVQRGCDRTELERYFQKGRSGIRRPSTDSGSMYAEMLASVAKEYGVDIRPQVGMIDRVDVKLQNPKIRR